MIGSGSIVFKQFIEGNETYIVDTITVDVSQLNLVEDKNELVFDVSSAGFVPNAQYIVLEEWMS